MEGRIIVVTGASSGIGAAFAKVASQRGAKVVLVARREAELRQASAACAGETLIVPADVTKRSDVKRAVDEAIARFGHIDVWVNNAGRGISRMTSELTDDDFDEMMTVNVKSALYGMQEVLPHLKARGSGHIVNVSSVLGRVPMAPQRSAYSAAKHALNALTATLRMELRATHPHIIVASVHPGVVATEFGLNAKHGGVDSRQVPGGQTAEEVAVIMADAIESRRVDVYTPAHAQQLVLGYFGAEDMGAKEASFGPPR
jgi:NAD(P)-dependent dehydrogenase (short-subunit alcohol dehydrogenase family)